MTTTDVRKSNSAAMYLSLLSYVANDDNVVEDRATAQAVAEKLAPLFLRQGFQESSSASPFTDYATMLREARPDVVHVHNVYPLLSPWIVRMAHATHAHLISRCARSPPPMA